jgi:hypothetical protein
MQACTAQIRSLYFAFSFIIRFRFMIQRFTIAILFICCFSEVSFAQFSVSDNKRYLLKDGKPFFWLGDTAWELFHKLNREEADRYLKRRSEQGFTVVQAVVLAELDGLRVPNAYGEIPLINQDPSKPNEKYFEHVDYIVSKAAEYNITIGMLPTWGDKLYADRWGKGPEIFNEGNAATYATWLANRYKDRKNIIWILGGDRNPRNESDIAVWRAMGTAIKKATANKAVVSYHPQPVSMGSATWFHNETWLDFNMFQTGHCRDTEVYNQISSVYNKTPTKPVLDGEPIYEDHPVCFNAKELGTSNTLDIRKAAYLDLFAGAFGHTYGCHDIWQMYSPKDEGVNGPHMFWYEALELPGANQLIHLKNLLVKRNFADRVPDQSLIIENNLPAAERIQATRGNNYILVYTSAGRAFTMNMGKLKAADVTAYWYSPAKGTSTEKSKVANKGTHKFTPPSSGYGHDWVLVVEEQ